MSEPVLSGEIPDGGVLDVLREIEARRITGRLRFSTEGMTGDVAVVAGQIALEQEPMPDGSDPVEVVLKARKGHYVVHQRLPTLPVSRGDDDHRKGSLAVHVPADLMNYCEQSGVTGLLRLTREGKQAELVYEAGELLAIRLDGKEDADLSAVFSWDDGAFDIRVQKEVKSYVPEAAPSPPSAEDSTEREPTTQFVRPRHEDTGRHFLKVFEVALTDVVSTRERVRPKARTSPPMAPAPSIRPPPAMPKIAPPRPARRREQTVRIAYLAGDDESALAAIDHVTRQAREGGSEGPAHIETKESTGEQSLPPPPPKEKKGAERAEADVEAEAREERADPTPEEKRAARVKEAREARARARAEEAAAAAPGEKRAPAEPTDGLGSFGWTVVVLAAGVAAYYLLSHLLAAS